MIGALVLLQADRTALKQREGGRRDTRETGDRENDTTRDAKLRETVLALLKRCQVSRAVRGYAHIV